MLDTLAHLGAGFIACFNPVNLLMLAVGIVVGLLVGVLPGLTLVMGVVLFLPFTYSMDVTASIILLTAMYEIDNIVVGLEAGRWLTNKDFAAINAWLKTLPRRGSD